MEKLFASVEIKHVAASNTNDETYPDLLEDEEDFCVGLEPTLNNSTACLCLQQAS